MNKKLVIRILGAIMVIEGLVMLPSLVLSLIFGDGDTWALLNTMVILIVPGLLIWLFVKPAERNLRAKEGFLIVGLGWIILSVFGALPLYFSGVLPRFEDALFESVSGFTTTGATVITQFDDLPRGIMFWRAFTHWIGGMGVLVLTLALLPKLTGKTSHLVKAESPGPSMSKLAPKMSDSAKILYAIYLGLTVLEFICLLLCGLNPYDAALHAISNAGTGGFSNYSASVAAFDSVAVEMVITVFMFLFGVNFALFYRLLLKDFKSVFHDEELRWYCVLFAVFTILLSVLILPVYHNIFTAFRYAVFQIGSIFSTTGFAAADYMTWPVAAQALIFVALFFGAMAGSTAGGLKTVRIALLAKMGRREITATYNPRKVRVIRLNGEAVDENLLKQIAVFGAVYFFAVVFGGFLLSLDGQFDLITHISASLTCVSNVGPGFNVVGPTGSFAGYGVYGKLLCSFLMLAGRLELFPMFVIFHPAIWRRP